jgi:hypothetical protein
VRRSKSKRALALLLKKTVVSAIPLEIPVAATELSHPLPPKYIYNERLHRENNP